MNIHQLHHPASNCCGNWQECFPCETANHAEESKFWPKALMCRCTLPHVADERLGIRILNPHPDLILRHVKIAFLTASPNARLHGGVPPVKFAPTHGIEFGDIPYGTMASNTAVQRNVIMVENQPNPEGQQIYAGVCFTAYNKAGEVKHYGYLLFRSGLLLPSTAPLQMAA